MSTEATAAVVLIVWMAFAVIGVGAIWLWVSSMGYNNEQD